MPFPMKSQWPKVILVIKINENLVPLHQHPVRVRSTTRPRIRNDQNQDVFELLRGINFESVVQFVARSRSSIEVSVQGADRDIYVTDDPIQIFTVDFSI